MKDAIPRLGVNLLHVNMLETDFAVGQLVEGLAYVLASQDDLHAWR